MKYWFYIGYAHRSILWKYMYFYFTYSIKTKILSKLGTGYFLKILKINSQQEKQICPHRKKSIPAKHKKLPIREKKISYHTVNHFLLIIINAAVL